MKEKDSDDENEIITYKVILVGESTVGKTSIINRFLKDSFQENLTQSSSASYAEKTIKLNKYKGKEMHFGIWDTVGQEKFRSLAKMYFQNATAAILVYDITKKITFLEIEKFWYNHVIQHSPEGINKFLFFLIIKIIIIIVIALAANKSDLYEKEEEDFGNEVKRFEKENDLIFFQTSACTGIGIDDLFEEIGNKIMEPDYKEQIIKRRKSKSQKKNINNFSNISNDKNKNENNKNNSTNSNNEIKDNNNKKGKNIKLEDNNNNNTHNNHQCC